MPDFPQIDPKTLIPLRVLASELAQNPALLEDPECPYDLEIRAFLTALKPKTAEKERKNGPFSSGNTSKWAVLESETIELYEELREFGTKLKAEDTKEMSGFFRTATALLEKLIGLNERALGLKRIHEFQETVLGVIDTVLTPSQRTEVMRKLRESIDPTQETPTAAASAPAAE